MFDKQLTDFAPRKTFREELNDKGEHSLMIEIALALREIADEMKIQNENQKVAREINDLTLAQIKAQMGGVVRPVIISGKQH